jgi:hypothetical protein
MKGFEISNKRTIEHQHPPTVRRKWCSALPTAPPSMIEREQHRQSAAVPPPEGDKCHEEIHVKQRTNTDKTEEQLNGETIGTVWVWADTTTH